MIHSGKLTGVDDNLLLYKKVTGLAAEESSDEKLLHELNNALTVILGNARFLAIKLDDQKNYEATKESLEKVERIRIAAEKGAALVSRLQKSKSS
jgi:nitrogen-specific signal transduction histidine kinase